MKNFKSNLKRIRKARQLTQVQLAKKAGIEQAQVSDYERGKAAPSLQTAVWISIALGCTLDKLVGVRRQMPGVYAGNSSKG